MTEVATPVATSRFPAGFAGEGEGDPSGSGEPGAGASGGSGGDGSPPAADGGDAFAQDRERYEATVRQLQSERDRATAELARLRTASAASTETRGAGGSDGTPGLTAQDVLSLMRRERSFANAETTLREQFPYADESIFDRSLDFDSVEAFSAAVEQSHSSIKARATAALEAEKEALLKPYIEKYGQLNETPPDHGGGTPTGDPTPEELRAMTSWELAALEEANPGVIDRVRRSA